VIVIDNTPETSIQNQPMFAMSGDGTDDVKVPVVFLFKKEADELLAALNENSDLEVNIHVE
jgi:ER degradation enhancer, mannosidase alpha-like 3